MYWANFIHEKSRKNIVNTSRLPTDTIAIKIERKINYFKSIIVLIKYENEVVFTGDLNFEGIE